MSLEFKAAASLSFQMMLSSGSMYIINSNGPRQVPRGTSEQMSCFQNSLSARLMTLNFHPVGVCFETVRFLINSKITGPSRISPGCIPQWLILYLSPIGLLQGTSMMPPQCFRGSSSPVKSHQLFSMAPGGWSCVTSWVPPYISSRVIVPSFECFGTGVLVYHSCSPVT